MTFACACGPEFTGSWCEMQARYRTDFRSPFQGFLSVHDAVAQRDFEPTLPPVPDRVLEEEDEDSFKIVSLVKTKEPLVRKHAKQDLCPGRFATSVFGKAGGRGCQSFRTLIPLSKSVINLLI